MLNEGPGGEGEGEGEGKTSMDTVSSDGSSESSSIGSPIGVAIGDHSKSNTTDNSDAARELRQAFEELVVGGDGNASDVRCCSNGLSEDEGSYVVSEDEMQSLRSPRRPGTVLESKEDAMGLLVNDVEKVVAEDGTKYINDYRKIRKLEEGGTCTVKLFKSDIDGKFYAFKCFRKYQLSRVRKYFKGSDGRMGVVTALDRLQREIDVLAALTPHENVCSLVQILDGPSLSKLYLVFPYIGGGQLMRYDEACEAFWSPRTGGTLPLSDIRLFTRDISRAILHLHKQGIVHRDIKPENIVLTSPHDGGRSSAVLTDFSSAVLLQGDGAKSGRLSNSEGTYAFFSPERCKGGGYNGYAADIWALGVTVYVMAFGLTPFNAAGPSQLFSLIADAKTALRAPTLEAIEALGRLSGSVSRVEEVLESDLMSFVEKLLARPEAARPKVEEIVGMGFLSTGGVA